MINFLRIILRRRYLKFNFTNCFGKLSFNFNGSAIVGQSVKVLLNLFTFVLNRGAEIGQHFLVKADHSVVVHVVLCLTPL